MGKYVYLLSHKRAPPQTSQDASDLTLFMDSTMALHDFREQKVAKRGRTCLTWRCRAKS